MSRSMNLTEDFFDGFCLLQILWNICGVYKVFWKPDSHFLQLFVAVPNCEKGHPVIHRHLYPRHRSVCGVGWGDRSHPQKYRTIRDHRGLRILFLIPKKSLAVNVLIHKHAGSKNLVCHQTLEHHSHIKCSHSRFHQSVFSERAV